MRFYRIAGYYRVWDYPERSYPRVLFFGQEIECAATRTPQDRIVYS